MGLRSQENGLGDLVVDDSRMEKDDAALSDGMVKIFDDDHHVRHEHLAEADNALELLFGPCA